MASCVSKLNFTLLLSVALLGSGSAPAQPDTVKSAADAAVSPVMKKYGIPGMTVGIVVNGDRYVFNYGVASRETHAPVTDATLFEIGSISKTFTATLASWAQADGQLSLADRTSKYLPALRGTKFGEVTLLNLGTHTPGGLPLQLPDAVTNDEQLMQYLQQWRPAYAPGTYRTYSNPGVGVLGIVTAKAMHQDFVTLVQQRLFPALGMTSSYINLPQTKIADYAQGYTVDGKPIRMAASVISNETYGIKTTAGDLLRFLEANMTMPALNDALGRAITETHIGYFKAGAMIQDLIWEQYAYPVTLETLLRGNSAQIILNATPVTAIRPPMAPRADVLVNKTGSTNGFGAYVAFIPQERTGIVILANKSYPIAARVALAYELLSRLEARR
jgi:beta-lactamase class C